MISRSQWVSGEDKRWTFGCIHLKLSKEDQAGGSLEAIAPRNHWRPVGPRMGEMKHPRRSHLMVCLSMPRSPEWQETHDPRKSQLYENKDNGEFWYLLFLKLYMCIFNYCPNPQSSPSSPNFYDHQDSLCRDLSGGACFLQSFEKEIVWSLFA